MDEHKDTPVDKNNDKPNDHNANEKMENDATHDNNNPCNWWAHAKQQESPWWGSHMQDTTNNMQMAT